MNMQRRKFFSSAVGISAALTASVGYGAQAPQSHDSISGKEKEDKWWTRHMEDMTSREVEFYLKEGGDLVFIPFGPVSGHGERLSPWECMLVLGLRLCRISWRKRRTVSRSPLSTP